MHKKLSDSYPVEQQNHTRFPTYPALFGAVTCWTKKSWVHVIGTGYSVSGCVSMAKNSKKFSAKSRVVKSVKSTKCLWGFVVVVGALSVAAVVFRTLYTLTDSASYLTEHNQHRAKQSYNPLRWRGNTYIQQGGILPYQLCNNGDADIAHWEIGYQVHKK